jgi:predicted GTPase
LLHLDSDPSQQEKVKAGEVISLAHHVAAFDREKIIQGIFKQIYSKSILIYVIDIINFEGSQIDEIYKLINEHKHHVLIVVNKIDALPKGFTVDRL